MLLSKIVMHLCVIIRYIWMEKAFAGIVYYLPGKKKYQNVMLNITLKLMVNK